MYFIAHRGNTNGPQPTFENKLEYLRHAYFELNHGVECDVRSYKNKLYLGHDDCQQPVEGAVADFIKLDRVYVHAKDIQSIPRLITLGCNVFFHKTDDVVFTSRGQIWCYPGKYVRDIRHAIWLDLDWSPIDPDRKLNCLAVCGDKLR